MTACLGRVMTSSARISLLSWGCFTSNFEFSPSWQSLLSANLYSSQANSLALRSASFVHFWNHSRGHSLQTFMGPTGWILTTSGDPARPICPLALAGLVKLCSHFSPWVQPLPPDSKLKVRQGQTVRCASHCRENPPSSLFRATGCWMSI